MESSTHVRDSVQEITPTAWLIGSKHILRHSQEPCENGYLWKNDRDRSYYTLSTAPTPLPKTTPLPPGSHVCQIHDAGDASAVFKFGDTLVLKVRIADEGTRREHETLSFLAEKNLSFKIPKVLFYTEEAEKVYLLEPLLPGKRLNEAWWDMTEKEKEFVVTRVSDICLELMDFQSSVMTEVDHTWLDPLKEQRIYEVGVLQKHCEGLGMDCSTFVLSHNDLGPTNIIVNKDQISVLDWELAGYCPLAWVRTKFAICGAFNAERAGTKGRETNGEYSQRVEQKLGELGLPEVTQAYKQVKEARYEEWKRNRPWLE